MVALAALDHFGDQLRAREIREALAAYGRGHLLDVPLLTRLCDEAKAAGITAEEVQRILFTPHEQIDAAEFWRRVDATFDRMDAEP